MRLLGGVKGKVVKGDRGLEREEGSEKDISREEIRRVRDGIKEEKTTEIDGIPGEI